jgi:hypothetical protein
MADMEKENGLPTDYPVSLRSVHEWARMIVTVILNAVKDPTPQQLTNIILDSSLRSE